MSMRRVRRTAFLLAFLGAAAISTGPVQAQDAPRAPAQTPEQAEAPARTPASPEQKTPEAHLTAGLDAWEAGQKERAADEWKAAADAGEPISAYLMAKLYETGNVRPRVPKAAFEYMKRAAEGGHIQAQVELANMYREGLPEADLDRDIPLAFHWYEEAAIKQHAEAQFHLGELHYAGIGVEPSRMEGIRWFQLAAKKYYTPAHIRLARMYWEGEPLSQDRARAYSHLLLARLGATDETRPQVDELMAEWEGALSTAQLDAAARLADAYRAEHPKR